jgi:hypothetical protein
VVQETRCADGEDLFEDAVDEMFVNTFLMVYVGPFLGLIAFFLFLLSQSLRPYIEHPDWEFYHVIVDDGITRAFLSGQPSIGGDIRRCEARGTVSASNPAKLQISGRD